MGGRGYDLCAGKNVSCGLSGCISKLRVGRVEADIGEDCHQVQLQI